jgi:hypothetical protein
LQPNEYFSRKNKYRNKTAASGDLTAAAMGSDEGSNGERNTEKIVTQ